MSLQISFPLLLAVLATALGAATGLGKWLLAQHQQHQDRRSAELERSIKAMEGMLSSRLDGIEAGRKEESSRVNALERELLQYKAELPLHYVRREDYIRGQSVIEAKLDGLALRWENLNLKGGNIV